MKAISLWNPWAYAVPLGLKGVETRSWATNYRGPIAIHAALNRKGISGYSFTRFEYDEIMSAFREKGIDD
jgi:hypothetical protein